MNPEDMPWVVVTTILTTIILLVIRTYDHYHQKEPKDLKLYLDIEKALKETGHSEEAVSLAQKVSRKKLNEFKVKEERKLFRAENHPVLDKIYYEANELNLFSIVTLTFSVLVACFFAAIHVENYSYILYGLIIGSVFWLISGWIVSSLIDKHLDKKQNPHCNCNCETNHTNN